MAVGGSDEVPPTASLSDLSLDVDTGTTSTKVCQMCVVRVVTRLVLLGLLLLLAQFVDVREHVNRYCLWVKHVEAHSLREAVGLYALGATAFATLSPTGYLPTVLAGALFPWYVAWPLSYAVTNLGALFNLVLVRGPCHPAARKVLQSHARLQQASGFGGFGWLDTELRRAGPKSWRVVALVRLPYLWTGLFNYIFALSAVRGRAYIVGNIIGLLPGALIFSLLGDQAQSLLAIVTSSSQSGSSGSATARRDEIALLGLELVFLVGATAALSVQFRRLWQRKAEEQAARGSNTQYEERVALLGDVGEVVAEAREEGLGFIGIGDPVEFGVDGMPFGRQTIVQASGGRIDEDHFGTPSPQDGGRHRESFVHSPNSAFAQSSSLIGVSRRSSPERETGRRTPFSATHLGTELDGDEENDGL
eukprot:COSAG02_NODE_8024_length_2743_cov_1.655825_1_plen_419_part_00